MVGERERGERGRDGGGERGKRGIGDRDGKRKSERKKERDGKIESRGARGRGKRGKRNGREDGRGTEEHRDTGDAWMERENVSLCGCIIICCAVSIPLLVSSRVTRAAPAVGSNSATFVRLQYRPGLRQRQKSDRLFCNVGRVMGRARPR